MLKQHLKSKLCLTPFEICVNHVEACSKGVLTCSNVSKLRWCKNIGKHLNIFEKCVRLKPLRTHLKGVERYFNCFNIC